MAQKAKQESDETTIEVQKPDFARALKVLNHDIRPSEERSASSRGKLSAAWKAIEEDCHCNKAAAKTFHKLTGMSDEKRDDFLRTLYGLMRAGDVGISRDLVDQMEEGEAPDMPVVGARVRDGLATLEQVH